MNAPIRTAFDEVNPGMPPALAVSKLKLSTNRTRCLQLLATRTQMSRKELLRALGGARSVTYRTFEVLIEHELIQARWAYGAWVYRITPAGRAWLETLEEVVAP